MEFLKIYGDVFMRKVSLIVGLSFISVAIFAQSAGDLIITEYMANPRGTDPGGEYFELYNTTNNTINIDGWVFKDDGSDSLKIDAGGTLNILPKGFLVLGRSTANSEQIVNRDYIYGSGFAIGNGADEIVIQTDTGTEIARINYSNGDPFFLNGGGQAVELSDLSDHSGGVITQSDVVAATDDLPGDAVGRGSPGYAGNTNLDVTVISGDAGWRLISIPKSGATVSDISDDTAIQGVSGGSDSGATTNIVSYDSSGTYATPASVNTALGDGYGLAVYFFNNTSNGSSELPIELDATGGAASSDVSVKLNKVSTAGTSAGSGASNSFYTLVGNPFAAHLNLNSITVSGGSIQDNVQFWNNGTSSYIAKDRTSSFIIAPWQAFFVEVLNANGATDITIPTSGIDTLDTSGSFFSKAIFNQFDIKFTLKSENTFDEAIKLSFRDYATLEMDRADATKLTPWLTKYATIAFEGSYQEETILKSVESLPINLQEEVTLNLQSQFVGVDGEFTFAWNGLETIPGEWELILHDYELETSVDMREVSEYIFNAEADAQAKRNPLSLLTGPAAISMKPKTETNRFGITIRPTSVSNENEDSPLAFALEQNYPNPFNPSTSISYSLETAGAVNISVYNLMGQKVATLVDESKSAGQYNVRWNAANVSSGMYYYRLEANGQSITRKMTLIK